MKVTREQAGRNRERIVDVATKSFREMGFNGIGVADLMKQAGLTHGGFYKHFDSKDDLVAEAVARSLDVSFDTWKELASSNPGNPLAGIASFYLSAAHRDEPSTGCAFPTLSSEVARQKGSTARAYTRGLQAVIDLLSTLVPGAREKTARKAAIVAWCGMVGAVALSRAVDDPVFSNEILDAMSDATARAGERR